MVQLERRDGLELVDVGTGMLIFKQGELLESQGVGEFDTSALQTLRLYLDAFSKEERPSWLPPKP